MPEPGGRILIVDDNKVNRLLMSRSVELLGHSAATAENGRVALDLLEQQSFDLLLLDIEMPVMNGFEVLEALKPDARLRDLPVIVTSSVEGVENIVRCIELGAEDYLPKPVNKVLLKARLSSCLEKKTLRDEQRKLLRRFATPEVADDLQDKGFAIGGRRVYASVLFCDIRGFTTLSENRPPEVIIDFLNTYYTLMFEAVDCHDGIVSLMAGDGLMAVFGAPQPLENPPQNALSAATEMLNMIREFNEVRDANTEPHIQMGIGIATGEVVAGYAGTDQRATYTCIGSTVNRAARLEAHSKVVGRSILMDEETRRAVDPATPIVPLEPVRLKGLSNPLNTYCLAI